MTNPATPSLTELLGAAQGGDLEAQDAVARAVYAELRGLADGYLRGERWDHTLQPTALVNEAYLRLMGQSSPWRSRSHFLGIAASMMRRILVDHARRHAAERRDRKLSVSLDEVAGAELVAATAAADDVLGVHEALVQLEARDPRQARIVELKFFVGLSLEEIAELLEISSATVSREWTMARVWLHQRISDQ